MVVYIYFIVNGCIYILLLMVVYIFYCKWLYIYFIVNGCIYILLLMVVNIFYC